MRSQKRPVTEVALLAVLNTVDTAVLLSTSQDRVVELVHAGHLATVPHLSTPRRIMIARAEIDRFCSEGVAMSGRKLRSVAS